MGTWHFDEEVEHKLTALADVLCQLERSCGRETLVIMITDDFVRPTYVALNGRPLPPESVTFNDAKNALDTWIRGLGEKVRKPTLPPKPEYTREMNNGEPTCRECGYHGSPDSFPAALSVYHDVRCPKCGTTNIDGDFGDYKDNSIELPPWKGKQS